MIELIINFQSSERGDEDQLEDERGEHLVGGVHAEDGQPREEVATDDRRKGFAQRRKQGIQIYPNIVKLHT